MNLITQRLIEEAHKDIGVCEVERNNGPKIDEWLCRVGQKPGAPWCVAWAWCKLDDAIKGIGYTNHLPPTASVHRLFELAHQHHAWWPQPGPGYIFGIDHGAGQGHCGIVLDVRNDTLATIEGNTNRKGEREGKWVLVRTRAPEECTLGYLDPGMLLAGQVCSEARPENG